MSESIQPLRLTLGRAAAIVFIWVIVGLIVASFGLGLMAGGIAAYCFLGLVAGVVAPIVHLMVVAVLLPKAKHTTSCIVVSGFIIAGILLLIVFFLVEALGFFRFSA